MGYPGEAEPFHLRPWLHLFSTHDYRNAKFEIKSYQSASPDLMQYMNDARLPPYKGQAARRYSDWAFTAVRTVDEHGNDRSTVRMSTRLQTLWNPIRPWDGVWMSNYGRNIRFLKDAQILLTFNDHANARGGSGTCGGADTLDERPFDIPNDVFEAMTHIAVEALPELFFACR
jgi:hypothetical protein